MGSTAYNGWFGVMAAVAPQKRQYIFETLYPAATTVEAITTPSRWDERRNAQQGATLGVGSSLRRVKSKAPALQVYKCKSGDLLFAERSERRYAQQTQQTQQK